jgi:putative ABC transport system permease protein
LIIVIACINHITLSISLSAKRSIEVGIKKVLGAGSQQLIRQFFIESFILTMIAMFVGIVLMFVLYKPFNHLIGKEADIHIDSWLTLFCLSISGLVALLSGLYPAVVMSRNNLIQVTRDKIIAGNNRGFFRKGLITFQFVLSIGLIVCALGIGDQLNYLNERDLGFKKENVIIISTNQKGEEGLRSGRLFANSLKDYPAVIGSSIVMFSLAESPWAIMGYNDNNKVYRDFEFNSVDTDFFDVMKIEIAQGTRFNSTQDSGLIVNETLAKEYGWSDPIGKTMPGPFNYPIRGVVKDFNVESLHTKIKPLVLSLNFDAIARTAETMLVYHPMKPKICVRLQNGHEAEHIEFLKRKWHEIAPGTEFQYSFVDEKIQKQYQEDQRISGIVKLSSVLAILIACAGLYGIVALFVTTKTKEIAIRKVLGASATRIVAMISKEFLALVFIATCISFPLAWLFMEKWRADFAYRVNLNYYLFITGALIVILLAFITICIQTFKTATANPADKMRSD